MSSANVLTDPESFRANQHGQITQDQRGALKSKLGTLPGCFVLGLLFALIGGVAVLGGKTLSRSTPLAIAALVGVILVTFAIVTFLGNILGGLRTIRVSVEQVTGQVTWYTNRYAVVCGKRLMEPIVDVSNLQPGDYTFYRMRGTKYILSAQHAGTAASAQSAAVAATASAATAAAPMDIHGLQALLDQPLDFDPKLEPERVTERIAQIEQAVKNMPEPTAGSINQAEAADMVQKLFGQFKTLTKGQKLSDLMREFKQAEHASQPRLSPDGLAQLNQALTQTGVRNPAALHANAAGKQSAAQRFALTKEFSSNLWWTFVCGIGWLVLSYMFIIRQNWKGMLAVTALLGLIALYLLINARREIADFLSGSVQEEEGWVSKYSRSNDTNNQSYTYYYYQINNNNLAVSQYAYEALIEGNYRVYYLPNTRSLVNIDPISEVSQ